MNEEPGRRELLSSVASSETTGHGGPVDGRYNVGLKPSTGPAAASEVAGRADSVERRIDLDHLGVVVSGRFPASAREALANDDRVKYVEPDLEARKLAQQEPYGISTINADVVRAGGRDGSGATVAVLDTGVDDDHPDLPTPVAGKSFTTDCGNANCSNGNTCTHPWSDDDDHGSHVAGTVAALDDTEGVVGVAPGADLLAGKVLAGCGSGSFSSVADGIRWAADNGADVINMSLGGSSGTSTMRDACQYATDSGVVVVAAAGNSGPCTDCVGYPAAYSTVIAVSATDSSDDLASFSSTGPEVELAAPGVLVRSTIPPESDSSGDGYQSYSGTSMAAPHVAGAAALLAAETSLSNDQIRDRLTVNARDVGLSSNEQGSGRLDASNAVLLVEDQPYGQAARFQYAAPAVDDTRVYVAGLDGSVEAVRRSDGSQEWSQALSGGLVDSTPVLSGDGARLYVGSGSGGVYALATSDGATVWRHGTDSAVASSPAVSGGRVFVGTNDGRILALEDGGTGTAAWTRTVGAPVLSRPAIDTGTGTVVITTNDGDVVGLDAATGAETWRVATGTELGHAGAAVGGGGVYVAADDVFRIDAGTGTVDWRRGPYGGFSESTPVHDGGLNVVYAGRADGTVYALDDTTGGIDVTIDTGASAAYTPVVAGDRVTVTGSDGRLRTHDAGSGEGYSEAGVGTVRSRPVVDQAGDAAFVTTWSGSLVRLENV